MQNYDIPLHDIKPIIQVQEYSFYYLVALVAVGTFLLLSALYFLFKWYKSRNAFNLRKEHLRLINAIDLEDTKSAAYAFTFYGLSFKDDSPRHSEMYRNLMQRLDEYKYKKDVDAFDSETLGYLELYKGMLDV